MSTDFEKERAKLAARILRGENPLMAPPEGTLDPSMKRVLARQAALASQLSGSPGDISTPTLPIMEDRGRMSIDNLYKELEKSLLTPIDYSALEQANANRRSVGQRDVGTALKLALLGDDRMAQAGRSVLTQALDQVKPLRLNAADIAFEGADGRLVENPAISADKKTKVLASRIDAQIKEQQALMAAADRDNDRAARETASRNIEKLLAAQRGIQITLADASMARVDKIGGSKGDELTNTQRNEVAKIDAQIATTEGALKAAQDAPQAFGAVRGMAKVAGGALGESAAGRFDTEKEAYARARVYNEISALIKERAGTAQSAQELSRINAFMPADTDTYEQVKRKLEGYRTYLSERRTALNQVVPKIPANDGWVTLPNGVRVREKK